MNAIGRLTAVLAAIAFGCLTFAVTALSAAPPTIVSATVDPVRAKELTDIRVAASQLFDDRLLGTGRHFDSTTQLAHDLDRDFDFAFNQQTGIELRPWLVGQCGSVTQQLP